MALNLLFAEAVGLRHLTPLSRRTSAGRPL